MPRAWSVSRASGASPRGGARGCPPARRAATRSSRASAPGPARVWERARRTPTGQGRATGPGRGSRAPAKRARAHAAGAVDAGEVDDAVTPRLRSLGGLAHDRGPGARRAGPLPSREQALGLLRAGRDPPPVQAIADPPPPVRQLAAAERHAAQGDVQRPQEQREHEQPWPQLGELAGGLEIVDPDVGGCVDLAAARRGADGGEQRLVGAEQPVLGRRRRDEPERPGERRLAGSLLGDANGIGAAREVRHRRLVHARGDLVQVHGRRLEVGPDHRHRRRVEVPRPSRRCSGSRRAGTCDRPGPRMRPRCRRSPRPGTSSRPSG